MKKIMIFLMFVVLLSVLSKDVYATGGIQCSWKANTESDLAGYNVYIGTTHAIVAAKGGDITTFSTINNYFCYDVNDPSINCIFVGVTAFDNSGNESNMSEIVYSLEGNIIGKSSDGTPYTSAIVDGNDLAVLGANWGRNVTHPYYDCSFFSIDPSLFTQKRSADLNMDGRIDFLDYFILATHFGNTANR